MTVRAWRIVKSRFADAALNGEGARAFGGRWNSPGVAMVYAAGSISLAILERLVHDGLAPLAGDYVVIPLEFDLSLVTQLDPALLPVDWRTYPAVHACRTFGDDWVRKSRSAVLEVPSAVVPEEHNYLVNPAHPRLGEIRIFPARPLTLDPRLGES